MYLFGLTIIVITILIVLISNQKRHAVATKKEKIPKRNVKVNVVRK